MSRKTARTITFVAFFALLVLSGGSGDRAATRTTHKAGTPASASARATVFFSDPPRPSPGPTLGPTPYGSMATPSPRPWLFAGWYDGIGFEGHPAEIAREGLDSALPYDTPGIDPGPYLERASAAGVRVMLEIPRDLVRHDDRRGVASYVSTYGRHPALFAWYLADEPGTNRQLGPLDPGRARALYRVIKTTDPLHPVAMAFGQGEDPAPYRKAMDVLMFFDYPCRRGSPEFSGLDEWTHQLDRASASATAFVPILQGFAGQGVLAANRFPTAAEERYMIFTALQAHPSGLLFWTLYRSTVAWIDDALVPSVRLLDRLRGAAALGPLEGAVGTTAPSVRATAYADASGTWLVAVHRGGGSVAASLRLAGPLARATRAELLTGAGGSFGIRDGWVPLKLGPYDVAVYELS